MIYRCVATSEAGFVQQLAVAYVNHGYWFYVTGCVPGHKQPELIDQKLIEKYDVAISKWARARRKRQGLANVHYLRHADFFVLIATKGVHRFFEEERTVIRDVRRQPIRFAGYSIGYKQGADGKWHASVRIHPVEYNLLKDYCLELASQRTTLELGHAFERVPFEPYAPVRRQLLNILRAVNHARRLAGCEPVPCACLRLRRRPVSPFAQEVVSAVEGYSSVNLTDSDSLRSASACRSSA